MCMLLLPSETNIKQSQQKSSNDSKVCLELSYASCRDVWKYMYNIHVYIHKTDVEILG